MPTAVRSHAKINLGLGIGAPRPDGFHALVTVYQTLALYDVVTVTARPAAATALRLTSNDERVPTDRRNTAWKMVTLALEALELNAEVDIHIEKRLPVQGGLGAGSANAVAALVGLEIELGMGSRAEASHPSRKSKNAARVGCPAELGIEDGLGSLPGPKIGTSTPRTKSGPWEPRTRGTQPEGWEAKRLEIAAEVGSDVPLFLIGGAVLGLDRGQEVYPLPDIEPVWCVVATPEMGVSTPQAFRDWDALCAAEGLTAEASTDKLNKLSRAYASAFAGTIPEGQQRAGSSGVLPVGEDLAGPQESALVRTGISSWIQNDFERVVFPQHPPLAEIKRILMGLGTPGAAGDAVSLVASLSGSGSALFGLYRTRGDAEAARERLRTARVVNQVVSHGVASHLTRTLPRLAYWREMLSQ
jgi:4-diphosphocytidyl-2-C-methyl-D-erythritol kinase